MAKRENFDGALVRCYKILEGKQTVVKDEGDHIDYSYVFDAEHPLFSFSTYKQAAVEWERRVKEGFREHMLFVADFGVLSPRQERIVKWGQANARPCREDPRDKAAYINIAEYHKRVDGTNNIFYGSMDGCNHLVLKSRAGEKHFENDDKTCFDKVDYYRQHGTPFKLALINSWTDEADNFRTKYTRLRMVCSSHQLKSYSEMGMYIGCKKIRIHSCFIKPASDDNKTVKFDEREQAS